jgi:hypothetical protein
MACSRALHQWIHARFAAIKHFCAFFTRLLALVRSLLVWLLSLISLRAALDG